MWKTIPYFSKYEASDQGQILNKTTLQYVKQKVSFNNPLNYYKVYVKPDRKDLCPTQYIHRLICLAYNPISYNDYLLKRKTVNHKDGNKHNNKYNNLEWVSRSENMILAMETGLRNDNIEISVTNVKTNSQVKYYAVIQCALAFNVNRKMVMAMLYRHRKLPYKGLYTFSYNILKINAVVRYKLSVVVYDCLKKQWFKYQSANEASLNTGITSATISWAIRLQKSKKMVFGYYFYRTRPNIDPIYDQQDAIKSRSILYKKCGGNIDL